MVIDMVLSEKLVESSQIWFDHDFLIPFGDIPSADTPI
jgi:hypothetical protein